MPRTEDKYIVALDIGTSKVCVLVGEINERRQLEIIGKGTAPMRGTRRGNIINLDQAVDAVKKAVDEAEVMAGLQIQSWNASALRGPEDVTFLPLPMFHVYGNVGVQSRNDDA